MALVRVVAAGVGALFLDGCAISTPASAVRHTDGVSVLRINGNLHRVVSEEVGIADDEVALCVERERCPDGLAG